MSNDFSIPLHIEERFGLARAGEGIRIGVPLPSGLLRSPLDIVVVDATGVLVPHQARPLAFWGDASIKWLLVDALASTGAHERTTLFVRPRPSDATTTASTTPRLAITSREDGVSIDTGRARFEIGPARPGIESARVGNVDFLQSGTTLQLVDRDNRVHEAAVEHLAVEEDGPFRATVVASGRFHTSSTVIPIRFLSRAVFLAGSASVSMDIRVHNPQAAAHPGGLWDLGDRGSVCFRDLTFNLRPRSSGPRLRWYAETPADEHELIGDRWSIYQDSSGGERWDSANHIDQDHKPTVSFRGYRVEGGVGATLQEGLRATPGVTVGDADGWIAAATKDFWQNFPKALRWRDATLSIGLFPGETSALFELQGGEQKRHTVLLDFGVGGEAPRLATLQHPLTVHVDPAWVERSQAVLWFAAGAAGDERYFSYVNSIVDGPGSFVAKRELIDEYGWRNYGDLYADHEAVRHTGSQPFVSHYNNQYDFIYGAFFHFLRTGDARWRELMEDLARHVADIDIYHTVEDQARYNGGLFWHTDHYLPASTCTHRTYSRANRQSGDYGGGPSNEHNYTSGLLHYYYLTGDPEGAGAVLELGNWVIGLDDGARTMLGLAHAGPTGYASSTLEASFHHPGRGAGNSINALLDAYALSRERRYLAKAEELIARCIHPRDDIAALSLDDPEHRWSYLVFLQVLGKYLAQKRDIGETDYHFHYARESLLRYAEWMAAHEVPYKDVLHKVELPTETWPAHDVRKAHVFHLAASYAPAAGRGLFEERAVFFFDRCLTDLLSFATARLTRPLVILSVHGASEAYFRTGRAVPSADVTHNHDFGRPAAFLPQQAVFRSALASRLRVAAHEATRIAGDRLSRALSRWRRR